MPRSTDRLVDAYHTALTSYVDRGGDDHLALAQRMATRGAVYGGRPICPFLRPVFVWRSRYEELRRAIGLFRSAMVKARDQILATPELLELTALTDGERQLLDINPEFRSFGVVTRLDTMFTDDGGFWFVELNAEAAFGGNYADRLADLFEGFQPFREFCRDRRVAALPSGSALVRAVLDAWHEFGGTRVPSVAVVDWREVATRTEFDLVCERFQQHGIPARFVDPRELVYEDGVLKDAAGQGIDVIYRRVLTSEVLGREAEVGPLLAAYKAGVVCVVNSFRAKLLDKKVLFALLHDPRIQAGFTADEIACVREHVPWTRRVADGKATGPDGDEIDLLPWARAHKADLVLKPNDDTLGRGVLMGSNVEQSAWDRALAVACVDPSVLQRRVPLPTAMFPEVGAAGELFFSRRYVELDAYLFRGELGGLLARLSATTLCNVSAGAGTAPVFLVDDDAPDRPSDPVGSEGAHSDEQRGETK